ncbi:hypothetical protein H5T51_08935 [Candidatus Bathyarchaeota archaeon]|nr:hypothetical protein [Candidatus Bathyarchaeota archaeon]
MYSSVPTLLLLVASVLFACIVVDYAIATVERILQTSDIPQIEQIRALENSLLNQTDILINQIQNGTLTEPPP